MSVVVWSLAGVGALALLPFALILIFAVCAVGFVIKLVKYMRELRQ